MMNPHAIFPGAVAVALSVVSMMNASAAIVDRTQLLFSAPAYIFGNPDPVPMNHAHLIYLGGDTSDPSAVIVDYSFSLMDTGELGFLPGFVDGIYVDVERPPAHLVPPTTSSVLPFPEPKGGQADSSSG